MPASILQFPKDELLTCLRSNDDDKEQFLIEVEKQNMYTNFNFRLWIYQIIKYCYNILLEYKENPGTKVKALQLIKDLLETCQVPCITLIQIYVLPTIFQFAIFKQQETGPRRGSTFFQSNGYSPRIQGIQDFGIKFLRLCSETIFVGAAIKKHRTIYSEQLDQQSQYVTYFKELQSKGIEGTPQTIFQLLYYDQKFVKKANKRYLDKLNNFEVYSETYSDFFRSIVLDSLNTEQNPLFSNIGKTVSSITSDLDMRKLLKYGDPYVTSPLIQELAEGIKTMENLTIRKNYFSLLSDFVKWADIQSFVQILYDDTLDIIVPKIAIVNGQNGLNQGQNIFPQIKGQKEAKKKFYIQFLKSIEMWSKIIQNDLEDTEQTSKVEQTYQLLKVQRNFVFPENIMAKKLLDDYYKCEEFNRERNDKLFAKLKAEQTSLLNTKKSSKHNLNSTNQKKNSYIELEAKFENITDILFTLCDNEEDVQKKMKKLVKFRDQFQMELENLDNDRPGNQFEELLENGDFINQKITQVQKHYISYKVQKLSFPQFKQQYEKIVDQTQMLDLDNSKKSSKGDASLSRSFSRRSGKNNRRMIVESQQKVLSSFPPEKDSSFRPEQNLDSKMSNSISDKNSFEKSINISKENKVNNLPQQLNEYYDSFNEDQTSGFKKSKRKSFKTNSYHTEKHSSQRDEQQESSMKKMKESLENKQISKVLEDSMSHPYYDGKDNLVQAQKSKNLRENSQKINSKQGNSKLSESKSGSRFSKKSQSRQSQPKSQSKSSLKDRISIHREHRRQSFNSRMSRKSSKSNADSQAGSQNSAVYRSPEVVLTQTINPQNKLYNIVPSTHQYNRSDSMKKNDHFKDSKRYKKQSSNSNNNSHTHSNSFQAKIFNQNDSERSKSKSKSISKSKSKQFSLKNSPQDNSDFSATNYRPFKEHYEYYEGSIDEFKTSSLKKWNFKAHTQTMETPVTVGVLNSRSGKSENFQISRNTKFHKQYEESQLKRQQKVRQEISYLQSRNSRSQKNQTQQHEGEKNSIDFSGNYNGLHTSIFDEDKIEEPDARPVENSYYGYDEIQAKIRKSNRIPNFKQCFELKKQVIPVEEKKQKFILRNSKQKTPLFRRNNSSLSTTKQNTFGKSKQEEYLIKKLKKQYKKQKDQEIKRTKSRIMKLKSQESESKLCLSNKSDNINDQSVSKPSFYNHTSKGLISFSISKNNSGNSSSGRQSVASKIETKTIHGQILNDLPYVHYFEHIQNEKTKRTFLKQKALILKNESLQIGTLFNRDVYNLKITLFITPEQKISYLNILTSNQAAVDIKIYPDKFTDLEPKKQVKSTIMINLQNIPYLIPTLIINLRKQRETKKYELYLPCPISRFLDFKPVINIKEYLEKFQNPEANIIKFPWAKLSKKIGKIDNIMEYFPRLTRLGQEGEYTKYGAECHFKEKQLSLIITTRSPNKIAIQGIPVGDSQFLEFCLASLQHIFTLSQ